MRIVILGWGSLIWDPRDLLREGEWQTNGPVLPIEFSRISSDGRLTLVVDQDNGVKVRTRWVLSPRTSIRDAREDLRRREGTPSKDKIGFANLVHGSDSADEFLSQRKTCNAVERWLRKAHYDAAVWTALDSNFEKQLMGATFSVNRAMEYIANLPPVVRNEAFRYIFCAPPEVNTPVRRAVQQYAAFQKYVQDHQIG